MDATQERKDFSDRLRAALEQRGIDGSPTKLSRHFNAHGYKITVHAARKWLVGEAVPTQDKLRTLSGWLGVDPNWLRFGTSAGEPAGNVSIIPPRTLRLVDGFNRLPEREQRIVQSLVDQMLVTAVAA